MRKLILIILAMFLAPSLALQAQGDGPGNIAVELSMTPFTDSEAWLSPGFIKARYFLPDPPLGIRLSIGTGMLMRSDQEFDQRPETVRNIAQIDLRPGAEFHFVRTSDIVAYAGLDFIWQLRSTNRDETVGPTVTGAWDATQVAVNRGFRSLGFSAVAGGDYFLKGGGFFIGAEFGFEFLATKHHEVKLGDDVRLNATKSTQFRPSLASVIRLGVAF